MIWPTLWCCWRARWCFRLPRDRLALSPSLLFVAGVARLAESRSELARALRELLQLVRYRAPERSVYVPYKSACAVIIAAVIGVRSTGRPGVRGRRGPATRVRSSAGEASEDDVVRGVPSTRGANALTCAFRGIERIACKRAIPQSISLRSRDLFESSLLFLFARSSRSLSSSDRNDDVLNTMCTSFERHRFVGWWTSLWIPGQEGTVGPLGGYDGIRRRLDGLNVIVGDCPVSTLNSSTRVYRVFTAT